MGIPCGAAGAADMRTRPDVDCAIETSGGNDQQRATHLNAGKRCAAFGTEALLVARIGHAIGFDSVLSRQPRNLRRGREQIGGMRRPGVLAAAGSMTKKERFERSGDFKSNFAALA